MRLNTIKPAEGSKKAKRRVGRGIGSGLGKTAGRGQKGAKSRSGVSINGFEGGQMPLHMRIPKRGFNNIFAKDYAEVNIGAIQKAIDAGKLDIKGTLDHDALKAAGLARGGKDGVRLLGKGELKAKLVLKVAGVSKGAREAVEKAGGSIELIARKDTAELAKAKKGKAREVRLADKAAKSAAKAVGALVRLSFVLMLRLTPEEIWIGTLIGASSHVGPPDLSSLSLWVVTIKRPTRGKRACDCDLSAHMCFMECPLLALSGHATRADECPLLRVKRT